MPRLESVTYTWEDGSEYKADRKEFMNTLSSIIIDSLFIKTAEQIMKKYFGEKE